MLSFSRPTEKASSNNAAMVNAKFRRGYQIPLLPHQKDRGILTRVLWANRNHIIRIIPGYDKNTGEIYRQNIRCNEFSNDVERSQYVSDTFIKAPIIQRFGNLAYPIISAYPQGSPDDATYAGNTVLRAFCRNIIYACANKGGRQRLNPIPAWRMWTAPGANSMLSKDSEALIMQALIFETNGKQNTDPETKQPLVDADGDTLPLLAVVAIANTTSINNMYEALVVPTDRNKPLDGVTNNQYGGIAEAEGNKLFLNTYTDPVTHYAALRPSVQAGGEGWRPTPFPLGDDAIRALWHPWDEILVCMTAEEQLDLCAQQFGADTVNYVIGTDPAFSSLRIPEHIAKHGLGRYADVSGGSVTLNTAQPAQPAVSAAKGLGFSRNVNVSADTSGVSPDVALSDVDVHKIMEATQAIRNASKHTDQAAEAGSLLGDDMEV